MVRAAAFACAAFYAGTCLDGKRCIPPLGPVGKTVTLKIALKEENIGNADADGARCAVIAAAAEISGKSAADSCDLLVFFSGERGDIRTCFRIYPDLLGTVHARDNDGDVGVSGIIAYGDASVLNGAACEGLHGDETDIFLTAAVKQVLALAFDDIIGEHNSLDPIELERTLKDLEGMCGNAEMMDLPPILPA